MEYIYGLPPPPPSSNNGNAKKDNNNNHMKPGKNQNNRRQQQNNNKQNSRPNPQNQAYLDLPTHLPNEVPKQQPALVEKRDEVIEEVNPSEAAKEVVPVFGTNIVLKTEEDIEEWVKQRKLNWMKKISNSRPEPESKPAPATSNQPPKRTQRTSDPRLNRNQTRVQKPQHKNNHNSNKTNLNNLIIQREIQHENKAILDVIKELFEVQILKE